LHEVTYTMKRKCTPIYINMCLQTNNRGALLLNANVPEAETVSTKESTS